VVTSKNTLADLLRLAKIVRRSAISYRNFKVGVSAIGVDKKNCVIILAAANNRKNKSHPKNCAEMQIMRAAQKLGIRLKLVVVVGRRNTDSGSGKKPLTLHPCHECRKIMRQHINRKTGVVGPKTKIITARPRCAVKEVFTPKSLMKYHGENTN
jgi:cytidine deaminase